MKNKQGSDPMKISEEYELLEMTIFKGDSVIAPGH
jgi:hypothetical protein